MQHSSSITTFIHGFEALRLHAYMPTPQDVPTIGWGETGPGIKLGMPDWTREQADKAFETRMAAMDVTLTGYLDGKPCNQNQFDAMCSLAFNIGLHAFHGSSVLRFHLAGDYANAAAAFLLWNKQAGHTLGGLTRRRAAESQIYQLPVKVAASKAA